MTQYVKKLPAIFQTVTEKKFFDATFDQVFSKKDSSYLAGFVGRRNPGSYNPISDFYLPEPSKNRTWWQLESTAFARNPDTSKTNVFFYEDLLDNIEFYGGNTLNQDRLFNSEYYSFGPPIDYDMFINYHDYYWIDQRLPVITITGVTSADIIGKSSYTTPLSASPANFTLSTGMSIILADDTEYLEPHTVENFGGCTGIQLVPYFTDITSGATFEFLPWDGILELSTGRTIDNTRWDIITWDTEYQPSSGDYITIQRGSLNRNAWSRTNKWYHIDTIKAVVAQTGFPFPATATRALRPIIQFIADLELYKSGTQFNSEIDFGFNEDQYGNIIKLQDLVGQSLININSEFGISLANGDLVCFFGDDTPLDINIFPWDSFNLDTNEWDAVDFSTAVNQYIWETEVHNDGTVSFNPHTSWATTVTEGDIVLVKEDGPVNSAQSGETWYFENSVWQKAFNDKTGLNQPPLFILFDHTGTPLDDSTKYPDSTFTGNKVFSYKVNPQPGATVDPVLKFPIVYSGLGQASDIIFENNLITDRYTYGNVRAPITGYYYYKEVTSPVLFNSWNLYEPCPCEDIVPPPPCNCLPTSKQRVIDKYVVGYGTQYQFQLSVTPYGYPASPDLVVSVNDQEVKNVSEQTNGYTFVTINNRLYVDLTSYLTTLLITTQSQAPVVEIQTYTYDLLDPEASGYSAIPQQLEANPTQEEVSELSGSDLTQHFESIISNQIGFEGVAFGGPTNYRDSRKNRSVGQYILQNVTPLLKTMLVSPQGDLSFFDGIRFSADEYSKFKNKYLKVALQLINQQFNPKQYYDNTIVISLWVEEILKMVNISKEFSDAFAYSYMIANGSPFASETHVVPVSGSITLTNFVDLADPRNALYVYDVTGQEKLLIIGQDYEIVSTNLSIEIQFTSNIAIGNSVTIALYKNPLPAYIPSTPSKIGAYPVYVPKIEWDTSYVNPTWVIIGHDGSKTVAYGDYNPLTGVFADYRDALLLELEKRIYNLIQLKFRNQHYLPIRIESVKSGFFRKARYSRDEYLDITESYLNKWSAKNRANYRANDWEQASLTAPVNSLWKLYNYRLAVDSSDQPLNLPGNWKGIFQFMFDTYFPDTRPWEMLGFSAEPDWWRFEYGNPIINLIGQEVWPSNAGTATGGIHEMYSDIEAGIVRQGPSAIYDPITNTVQAQEIWARPGLSSYIPVDVFGEIRPIIDINNLANSLFDIAYSGNPYEPFDGFDLPWVYGDGAPVEQAWMSTSNYPFAVQEFLMLMRPAPYGEYMWDTLGTELSPGTITVDVGFGPTSVMSNTNWQFVQNDTFTNSDEFFHWMRPKNKDQYVHGETVDGAIQVRYGYQRWVSDRILFLGKNVGDTFGQKIRTLDVNLANKLAGFTNKDTTNIYIESVTPGSTTNTLIIPSTNFDVLLHKSPVVERYAYSGVVIRALEDGTFVVYGYDLLTSEFVILDRADNKLIDITVGGEPAPFEQFHSGATYQAGDVVRYNGVYYLSLSTQTITKFTDGSWQKLKALPTVGGVSVTYKPVSAETITKVPYGTILTSVQEVFDLLIGWGAWLETQGWQFTEVSQDTNQISDWLYSAKQFLFWLNTNWAPDASIQLSPLANKATLIAKRGYPDDVEAISNGIYNILDKYGVAISPQATITDRSGGEISVEPADLATGGIYFLQVNVSETEHILIFDNETSFADIVYSPLLRARQQRLRFNGFRTNGWYGKMEAPGYLVIDNQLVPNYDTIVNDMRYYYDPNTIIDNPSIEDLGRHLIGYESKSYLDNLQVSNDVQYLFYQGAIRQKGTIQALDKLFRSTKIQTDENIEIYEEWALKLGNFGNTVNQVSTEFILKPEEDTGNVVVARLNYVPSKIGRVKKIDILNAENIYSSVPQIVVSAPDADPADPNLTESLRTAKAFAILNSSGVISRIDISDPGYGYLLPPTVTINSAENIGGLDVLYSVWQGNIVVDDTDNNIIDIDIDETNLWIVRPIDPEYSLVFPKTNKIEYNTPNAGYVNFNDVDLYSFDKTTASVNWGTRSFNPVNGNTIWIANNFIEDWNVYKLVDYTNQIGDVDVVADDASNLWLRTSLGTTLAPEYGTGNFVTDFGNLISLQVQYATIEIVVSGGIVIDATVKKLGAGYVSGFNYTVPGGITSCQLKIYIAGGKVSDVEILSGGTGYADGTSVIDLPSSNVVSPETNYAIGFQFDPVHPDAINYNYYQLVTLDGSGITADDIPQYADFTNILLFKTMRFSSMPGVVSYINTGEKIWVDAGLNSVDEPIWAVYKYGTTVLWREQQPLIDTSMFKGAGVFSPTTNVELVRLPVYDPFKGILPAPVSQNLSYISAKDPARYNVTSNPYLFSENLKFTDQQVGKLWWDISTAKYVYYEQPICLATDPDTSLPVETVTENLIYRRNYWGNFFPGSSIDIYEWTKSSVPPSAYTGTGTPKDINTYVEISTINRFTNIPETSYYFWVLNPTDKSNTINRTLSANDISMLLRSPKSQDFMFFAPIQETDNNNSYMFYNVQNILAYKGNNVQIEYKVSDNDDTPHAQWMFFREGDTTSIITDQFWNKMVDSLCGYTKVLPTSDEYSNSIIVPGGEILPVPDPALSNVEKYGIEYRPRQGMFVNLKSARKVFVQSANNLLKYIPVRDDTPSWNANVSTSIYWTYTNWYKAGYEDAQPDVVFQTLAEANTALVNNLLQVNDIVQVINGTADGRYVLYAVVQFNPNISTLSLEEIGIENSAIKLLDTIYTVSNKYNLAVELRELLDAFRTEVMIDENLVDQNELFFSMINYVMSEQKSPNWLFKSSYIYIKETGVPLTEEQLYIPDQINNIIDYITDAKPYHTQIRDYASEYTYSDLAEGTAIDPYKIKDMLTFGPQEIIQLTPDEIQLNAQTFVDLFEQFVSGDADFNLDTISVDLTTFDPGKQGYSSLFPYTFSYLGDPPTQNNPQTFIAPEAIVAVRADNTYLLSGYDYYTEYNSIDETYTVYFYNDPSVYTTLQAIFWFNGGQFQNIAFNTYRNETALGFPEDDLVINVDTKLPANDVSAIVGPSWAPATVAPLVGWGTSWDGFADPVVSDILIAEGGTNVVAWDTPITPVILDYTISHRENNSKNIDSKYYRNNDADAGWLINDIPAPTVENENLTVITVSATADIFPTPGASSVAIWVDGERIEYRSKVLVAPNTWELGLLRRGTDETSAVFHPSLVPTVADPLIHVPNKVWVEINNYMPIGSDKAVWQASNTAPDLNTEQVYPDDPPAYTSVTAVPLGGLWYSQTLQAMFLKDGQGKSIP